MASLMRERYRRLHNDEQSQFTKTIGFRSSLIVASGKKVNIDILALFLAGDTSYEVYNG